MSRWRRLILVSGVLCLVNLAAALAVARPWLPHEENHVANGYFTHTKRTITFDWQEFPLWYYQSGSDCRCSLGLALNTPPPTTHYQTLTLGFLKIDRSEFSSTSPCGSAP